jgi:hypothetical protein
LEYEQGLWQTLLEAKYGVDKGITRVSMKHDDSAVWKDPLKVKHLYTMGRMMLVGNGQYTDFWKDAWCGTSAFCDNFPQLSTSALSNKLQLLRLQLYNGNSIFANG